MSHSDLVFTLTEQWTIVTVAGQFDIQLSLGELVITDRRGGIPMGSGPDIHVPLASFPLRRWVRPEDKQGKPMPLLARWDGVAMNVKESGGFEPAPAVEDRYHHKYTFTLQSGQLNSHPEGGYSIGLFDANGGEIGLLQSATNDMLTYPAAAIPSKAVTLRARSGAALPVRLSRSRAGIVAEWLPLHTAMDQDGQVPRSSAQPGVSSPSVGGATTSPAEGSKT